MKKGNKLKRKLIQIAAFGFSNLHAENFAKGRIYTGSWKRFCNPGLNCYSCPAASLACPVGALQAVSGSMNFDFSFYVIGFLLAVGALLGRAVCGFLCPFGLIQELVAKLPVRKHTLPRWTKGIKYAVLVIFVLLLPVVNTNFMGIGKPAFCQYICPSGTLLGGLPLLAAHEELRRTIGSLFSLKAAILLGTVVWCVFCYRFFCKTLCPLGAIYGLLNKISLYRLHVDANQCISCGRCARACRMEVDPLKSPDSAECIRCGECAAACPTGALRLGFTGAKPRTREKKTLNKSSATE